MLKILHRKMMVVTGIGKKKKAFSCDCETEKVYKGHLVEQFFLNIFLVLVLYLVPLYACFLFFPSIIFMQQSERGGLMQTLGK